MYTPDFATMLQVMANHQQAENLTASVSSGVMKLRETCRIEITIIEGDITSCAIVGNSGWRLTGKEAVEEIARMGRLRWTFTPQQEAARPSQAVSSRLPSGVTVIFPQHSMDVSPTQMCTWPRLHRAVFALADGTKSVTKIAVMLSTSPDLVNEELARLEHDLAHQAEEAAREKQQLEASIQRIVATHMRVANGDYNARVPVSEENVLWQISGPLNNLLARTQRWRQDAAQVEQLTHALALARQELGMLKGNTGKKER